MGRTIATVLVVFGLVAGIALLDEGRERERGDDAIARAPAPPSPSTPQDGPAFGGASLTDCLGSLAAEPPEKSQFPGLSEQGVAEISKRVERLRGLRFSAPVDATFLDDTALDRRLDELAGGTRARELLAQQGEALILLGAIPPGADLHELTTEALTSQVVGLYVPETKELLVAQSGTPGAVEEITLAHELEHALADDDLGLPLPTGTTAGSSDRVLAAQSLVEGDATLTMELYALRYVSLQDQLDIADDPELAAGEGDLSGLPDFLRRQLLFPYEAGLQYVCDRYSEGGWDAVDEAYSDPPASTAQLLGLREADPVDPPPPGTPPSPWREVLRDQLGAASLAWLFAAPGGDPDRALPDPRGPISGWAGDRIVLWQRGEGQSTESALSASIVDEGGTLCGALIAWYGAAFPESELGRDGDTTTFAGDDRYAAIRCDGEAIGMGIAPSAPLAATLSGGE